MLRSITMLFAFFLVEMLSAQTKGVTSPVVSSPSLSNNSEVTCCRLVISVPTETTREGANTVRVNWDDAFTGTPATKMTIDVVDESGAEITNWNFVAGEQTATIDLTKLERGKTYTVIITAGNETAEKEITL